MECANRLLGWALIAFANIVLWVTNVIFWVIGLTKYVLGLIGRILTEFLGRPLSALGLLLTGWRIVGPAPRVPKYVIAIAPHRQGMGDVLRGLFARTIMRMPGWHSRTVMKIEIMEAPVLGWFLKLIGGIAADRDHTRGGLGKGKLVEKLIGFIQKFFEFMVVFTPEGTRKDVEWKYGFYKTAIEAGVPVVLVCFDYPTKRIIISDPIWLTGIEKDDFKVIIEWYEKHATNYSPKLFARLNVAA